MFNCRAFLVCCALSLSMTAGHAEFVDELQAIMNKVPKTCRSDYSIYVVKSKYEDCKENNVTEQNCCLDNVTREIEIIGAWNNFVRSCQYENKGAGPAHTPPIKQLGTSTTTAPPANQPSAMTPSAKPSTSTTPPRKNSAAADDIQRRINSAIQKVDGAFLQQNREKMLKEETQAIEQRRVEIQQKMHDQEQRKRDQRKREQHHENPPNPHDEHCVDWWAAGNVGMCNDDD